MFARILVPIDFSAPSDAVLGYARSAGIDLLAMGTHGRSGVAHLLMGSVAERVIRSAACPVMTTHSERPCVTVPAGVRQEAATAS